MCKAYDKSKGGDTRELQSRMLPPKKKLGRVTLTRWGECCGSNRIVKARLHSEKVV